MNVTNQKNQPVHFGCYYPVQHQMIAHLIRQTIVREAEIMMQRYGATYAKQNAPTSYNHEISGNRLPGTTPLNWLKGVNKCNQFVGETLYRSGYVMPTYTMPDGTKHYVNAEKLPTYTNHFDLVAMPNSGDLIVIDYPKVGESGAHVEVVAFAEPGRLITIGAQRDGVREVDRSQFMRGEFGNNQVYYLRPKKLNCSLSIEGKKVSHSKLSGSRVK